MLLCVRFLFSSPRALLNKKIKKREREGYRERERERVGTRYSCIHLLREPRNYSPSSVRKSQPAGAGTQMNDCCLLCRIISQEMCVHRRLWRLCYPPPPSPLFNMFPFVFLVSETKCCREGREKGCRLECKAWWEAWWWQAWRIWYRCPLESFIASCW